MAVVTVPVNKVGGLHILHLVGYLSCCEQVDTTTPIYLDKPVADVASIEIRVISSERGPIFVSGLQLTTCAEPAGKTPGL